MPDLLIELFSEEIPARMQGKAAEDLRRLVTDGLVEAGLTYESAGAFSTPRRLALTLHGLTNESPTQREERRGPKVGAPDKAIEGFLRGAGVARDDLEEREEKKGTFYYATVVTPGRPAEVIVAEVLERTIRNFPWPKSMRWGAGSLRWVRPLHRILCLLTDESGARFVDLDVDGIKASDVTEGHRFHAPAPFRVTSFEDYEAKLKRARVILSPQEREEAIWHEATNAAFAGGLEVVEDAGLLREVAGLVEWPVVLMGSIAEDFLGLPPEVLMTSMKEHQKFFSVRNPDSGRIEKFVTVANIEAPDNGAAILAGNQKVLAARLSDAKFFWENDLRVAKDQGMTAWTEKLGAVTFHGKLGTEKDRVERIAALAGELAPKVGADAELSMQAARVAKADLVSEMVYEFPELQGLMGRYYAEAAGLPAEVAAACEEHYAPLGPSDAVPTAPVSVAVSLAEKIDKVASFWVLHQKPTGSKDPFALRRAALGVLRLAIERRLRFSINDISEQALIAAMIHRAKYDDLAYLRTSDEEGEIWDEFLIPDPGYRSQGPDDPPDMIWDNDALENVPAYYRQGELAESIHTYFTKEPRPPEVKIRSDDGRPAFPQRLTDLQADQLDLLSFFHDRLKVHLRDEGVRHDVIDACLAMEGNDDLTLLVSRARALSDVLKTEDGENLLQGFKRANNILSQAEEKDGVEYAFGADRKFAEEPQENALFDALDAAEQKIVPAMQDEDFVTAMEAMAGLRAPIDAFFEAVQVNSDNQVVRRNRLNLLSRIRDICLQVADLRRVEG